MPNKTEFKVLLKELFIKFEIQNEKFILPTQKMQNFKNFTFYLKFDGAFKKVDFREKFELKDFDISEINDLIYEIKPGLKLENTELIAVSENVKFIISKTEFRTLINLEKTYKNVENFKKMVKKLCFGVLANYLKIPLLGSLEYVMKI